MLRKICLPLLLCAALLMAACQPGDEAPPEEKNTILGQSFTELLNLTTITGNYWQGVSAFEDCSYLPLNASALVGCGLLLDTQTTVDNQIPKNTVLVIDHQNNVVTGTMILAVPHFNLGPNTYTIGVSGSTSLSTNSSYDELTLGQTFSTANVAGAGLNASLIEFTAEERETKLIGKMKIRLSSDSVSDTATLVYGFALDKAL